MTLDPNNHERWKLTLGWHNSHGCVWRKIGSEWSGKADLSIKRKRCQTAEDKRDFVTFFSMSTVKHSVIHRLKLEKA